MHLALSVRRAKVMCGLAVPAESDLNPIRVLISIL
jgi:hypothetical protein